jgi:hypothetical protein
MVQLVCFQLTDANPAFEEALKSLGNWSNRVPGAWVLETNLRPVQVRDLLGTHMKAGDRLFVAQINGNWAGRGMGPGFPEWMSRRKAFEKAE